MMGSQRGYTLLELLVTVAIVMILAATAVQAFQSYRMRAYEAVAIQYMRSWPAAQQVYLMDTGHFADADETLAQGLYKINTVPTSIPYDFSIDSNSAQTTRWWGTATPQRAGLRYFCINHYGVVKSGATTQNCDTP